MSLHVLLLVLASTAIQDPPARSCETCKDRGVIACKLCATRTCKSERGYSSCSVEGECPDCGGARFRGCTFCQHAPEIDIGARRGEIAKWRESLKPIDDFMVKRDLVHVESPHFVLTFDLKKLDNKSASNPHDAAHLYLDRVESLFADFSADAGAVDEDFSNKTHVMVWAGEKDQEKASSKYTLEKTTTLAKLMGKKPVVSIAFGKWRLRSDADLHHAVVHQVAHCLLSNVYDGVWTGNMKGGWLDEGVAHLYEDRVCGEVAVWCYLSDEQVKALKLGRFETEVASALDQAPDFTSVASVDTVSLSANQRVWAWSYCDYIVRKHPGKLGAVAKLVKKQKPASEAIQSALGLSLTDFQLDWSTWVKATYSAKSKR